MGQPSYHCDGPFLSFVLWSLPSKALYPPRWVAWGSWFALQCFIHINSIYVIIWSTSLQNQQCDCAPREDTDQPGHPPVWSESSLSAWRKVGSLATHWTHSEGSDQTGRMPRLFWVFVGRKATLLVLSWGGSILFPRHLGTIRLWFMIVAFPIISINIWAVRLNTNCKLKIHGRLHFVKVLHNMDTVYWSYKFPGFWVVCMLFWTSGINELHLSSVRRIR